MCARLFLPSLRSRVRVRIARKGIDTSQRLGQHRWVVERTLAWEHQFPKLRMRTERTALTHQALFTLATALICWNVLQL